jgi:hypothetical protein
MSNWRKVLSWRVQPEAPKDTRALFRDISMRKPSSWAEVGTYDFHQFDTLHQQALLGKRVIEGYVATPYSTITPLYDISGRTSEFILHNQADDFYYYINTEGFSYARYTFRILNFPNA